MVEIDKIISERSDERILEAVKEIPDPEFNKLAETIMGYLELTITKSRPKGSFHISESVHRPDGKKYIVFISRRDEAITGSDVESIISYMGKIGATNGLILTTSTVANDGSTLADRNNIGLAEGPKFAALLRRFDLDGVVMRAADAWKERSKIAKVPGADRPLEESMASGYEALAAKDFMKALDNFDKAIMLKDDYDVPWRLKGNTLDEMGYHEQALECYKRALELHPESDETWFSLGNSLFALGRYSEEIICYERALQYNPVMQKALINKGSTLHRLGRFQEALETYDRVLKLNYRLEKVHNNRGATLHSLGRPNDALAAYSRAIELKHDYIEAWMNKGSLLFDMGRFAESLDAFTHMTQLRPEMAKGWYLRGLAAKRTGNISQAKLSFEHALSLDPQNAEAKSALEEISKSIAEKFTEVPRIVKDIFASEATKPHEAAELPVQKPVVYEDEVARVEEEGIEEIAEELYGDRAELLLLLGRLDEAFDYLGKSLGLEGENARLLTSAGNVLYRLGKMEAAVKSYEHAIESDGGYAPALFNLHATSVEMGEGDRAAEVSKRLGKSGLGWQASAAASIEEHSRSEFEQSIEDIEAAIAAEDLSELGNFEGLVKLEIGDVEGALQAVERTKTMPLDPSTAFNNCGVMVLKRKSTNEQDLQGASLEFDKAIRLQRNNHAAWNNRGCVLYKLERLREAVACFEQSSVMHPTSVSLTNKGFAQLSLDVLEEALQSFEQSLKVIETPEAYNNKGIVLERLGKHEQAVAAFREAIRMAPHFKDAIDNLKRLSGPHAAPEGQRPEPAPPGEEVFGDRREVERMLPSLTEDFLRERKKEELESMCEALGLNPGGTRADLILRILKARDQRLRR